ncbi:MAG TPA: hypothetical protein VE326_14415, partial [Candidatus Binatia bacterium]|nr:hypothetical protein [Candidatus Binatia bacterium]
WTRALICAGLGLVLFCGLATLARAEDPETVLRTSSPFMDLQRGDPIRVRLPRDDSFRARFLAATPETLSFASDKRLRHESRMGFKAIEGLDRRSGSHGHTLAGAFLGLVLGAGIGALISTSEEEGRDQWVATVIYGAAGAGSGLVLGIVAGTLIRTDDWAPVWER